MSITFGKNIGVLSALRGISDSSTELSKSYERLSSGLRINRSADDPAASGLASLLQSDSRIYTQAVRNVNDGISLLSIAEAATGELSNILTRLSELITQADNSVLTSNQLSALDTEADALREEYNRIVTSTSFNGISLFVNSPSTLTIQAGRDSQSSIDISLGRYLSTTGTASSSSTVGNGTLTLSGTIASGDKPLEIVLGDMNGDGINDIATSNYNDGTVGVHLGNGNGTFKARVSYAAGTSPRGLDMYDLNGDSNLDIISGDDSGHAVYILLGNGNGTFKVGTSFAVESNPTDIKHADVNGDGSMDLITNGFVSGVANVLIGNGNGTFKASVSYTSGSTTRTVTTGDFDRDGDVDFATTNSGDDTVGIFLNNGNGTFAAPTTMASGLFAIGLTSGDINGDSKIDLINTNYGAGSISVWLGNGNGTFSPRVSYSAPSFSLAAELQDMNGDGYSDVVYSIANPGLGGIGIALNNGNGTFKTAVTYSVGTVTRALGIGDITGDGVVDVISVNSDVDTLGIFVSGTTTTTSQTSYSGILLPSLDITTSTGRTLASAVVEGVADLVTLERGTIAAHQSRLSVALENATALSQNYAAAADRITSVDVAEEIARLTRAQILNQAATAILAQANLTQKLVLKLVGG